MCSVFDVIGRESWDRVVSEVCVVCNSAPKGGGEILLECESDVCVKYKHFIGILAVQWICNFSVQAFSKDAQHVWSASIFQ